MRDVEVPKWLSALPHAPEFRPTDTEFADPIAYISKIEKEASAYGICKIIPPLPRPSKKYVFANLNKSLVTSLELGLDGNECKPVGSCVNEGESRAVFTTRQQELGQSERKGKGVVPTVVGKQVWQSGELYTLDQFESKAKAFSKSTLGMVKDVSPLVVETMFWKADSEKPIYIEYANDVPGSGFGESSGSGSFQYFHKRRRKRVFHRVRESTHMKYVVSNVEGPNAHSQENGDCGKTSNAVDKVKIHVESPSISDEKDTIGHHPDKPDDITDIEGTAGWKLSNCPWNLQVIARSPGSLTRFMPDDIPGVTSPMVYIGMLFSWFAWHIEDHELHSLNFLHTGSSKTWYSVPGDHAFAFEEVIRTHAYGDNVDRLAALTMLGEKTTLLSPEIVVASDIPCCRLVQNPGEFVVTFPRAYHIGFSHGFNCGEAANFGTPQWLKVAKEAAVRRAAMNFLPMLSHQQLLYLLTMSFVTRVPRALLVGARSSRLRDRIKGERELAVKKAFIEDIVNENQLLSVLCGAKSTYRAVLWDPESLPSLNKELPPLSEVESANTIVEESSKACPSQSNHNLLDEMLLYMETVKEHYVDVDDDDFLSDFQVDYGTMACVACGILGFPFMTVVQPSQRASLDLRYSVQNKVAVQEGSSQDDSTVLSISALNTSVVPSTTKSDNEWNTSDRFCRPRVFCLEHAIQVQELLESKGGAEVLVICHADFQKIKNHAAAIAVELGSKYKFYMVPLDSASAEDLNLIDRAIDEDREEIDEDWSSILGVNLRHCIKMRRNSSSKHVDHALRLFGMPSDIDSCSSLSQLKWQHTRSRSRTQIIHDSKQSSKYVSSGNRIKKENGVIQYKRRKSKPKRILSETVRNTSENSTAMTSDTDNSGVGTSELDIAVSFNENTASVYSSNPVEGSKVTSSSPTGGILDHDLEKRLSVPGIFISTCDKANEDYSETRTTGEVCDRFLNTSVKHCGTSHSLVKISGKCTSEKMQIRSSSTTSLQDSIESESIVQVDDGSVSASVVPDHAIEEYVFAKGISLIENGSCVVDAPCIEEVMYSASSYKHGDKAKDEEIAGVAIRTPEGSDVMELPGHGNLSNFDQDSRAPVDDQHVTAGEHIYDASRVRSPTKIHDLENNGVQTLKEKSSVTKSRKRIRELEQIREGKYEVDDFIRSPCERLRPRSKMASTNISDNEEPDIVKKKSRQISSTTSTSESVKTKKPSSKERHMCDLEGCMLTFKSKSELLLHQQNQCHVQDCGKKFTCHRYLITHQRVHADDRPLKCSWKGCNMSFKWAWARTEHLRVHTGERPYKCKAEDCGKRFRFISDFSRHRRKTGHVC